jgi:hypothetical protein
MRVRDGAELVDDGVPPESLDLLDHLIGQEEQRGGIASPSALAVLRLMTNSNFSGCSTGNSVGLAPLRILST